MKYFYLLKKELTTTRELPETVIDEDVLNSLVQKNLIKNYRKIGAIREGSIVKLVDERPFGWNMEGAMDMYLNAELVVRGFANNYVHFKPSLDWTFRISDIAETLQY